MFVSWVLFPLLLAAIFLGCGFLTEACAGRRLPGTLIAPLGFAVVVVAVGIVTAGDDIAALATPAVVVLALAGLVLGLRRSGRRPDGWALAAAAGAFAVYAAPVVLSGEPTFSGYIKLDDTATWMAFVDRVMDHGRDLSGLEPSTYQVTLLANLPSGYPIGAFLPLGVGAKLTGTDVAWLVQPYMATLAALLALCLYRIAGSLLEPRPLRAAVAFGAAQPALLFGYSLWGGIKEVVVALLLALLAAAAPALAKETGGWRGGLPPVLATVALLTAVGSGALVWIAPLLGLVAVALWRQRGPRALLSRAAPLLVLVLLLSIPALFAAGVFSPTQGGLTDDAELGNLLGPLSVFQYAGIWPNGDFRLDPSNSALTAFLIGLALLSAIFGAAACWRRRAWEPLVYLLGVGVGSLAVFLYSSPWVGAKALASGSPSLLLLALAGAAVALVRVEWVLGGTVLGLIAAGVLWSNWLGYHDASLAPYGQLRELEKIGHEFAGEGPTLMTEYQPYGVRHFLREADAEGASELRYRQVPLRGGGELEKGEWADTDRIDPTALLGYRTLVLRRSPAQSRPPSPYSLVRSGRYYDVWQRTRDDGLIGHLPFGSFTEPAAVPPCRKLLGLARLTPPGGKLAAARREPTLGIPLTAAAYPPSWTPTEPGSPDLIPHGAGGIRLEGIVPRTGRYDFYLQGSVRNRLTLLVDGSLVGGAEMQLNASQQFLYLGSRRLAAGEHGFVLTYNGQSLSPGSGGPPEPIGPLVVSAAENVDPPVRMIPPSQVHTLCDEKLDWVDVLAP
ncbi:MAG TPA: hypothetical protein VKA35_00200 [Solirubrobacterales bacterium]|nr:hypothetical protein [Solirubrobacterales bacterium]